MLKHIISIHSSHTGQTSLRAADFRQGTKRCRGAFRALFGRWNAGRRRFSRFGVDHGARFACSIGLIFPALPSAPPCRRLPDCSATLAPLMIPTDLDFKPSYHPGPVAALGVVASLAAVVLRRVRCNIPRSTMTSKASSALRLALRTATASPLC